MKNIFEQGEFDNYQKKILDDAVVPITEMYKFAQKIPSVFISHKHSDLDDLKGLIGFLEKKYLIKAYIDSNDPTMPAITSGSTATRIKNRIVKCDKFILLATNGAIESKWCNWELGYGDAKKYIDHIVLLPMKPKGDLNSAYKGNEYMSIYPIIVQREIGDKYSDGTAIEPGDYVRTPKGDGTYTLTSLEDWLKK